jgi:hypothetical protein
VSAGKEGGMGRSGQIGVVGNGGSWCSLAGGARKWRNDKNSFGPDEAMKFDFLAIVS